MGLFFSRAYSKGVEMKIERSEEVKAQLQEAAALRTKLIAQLGNALTEKPEKKKGKPTAAKNPLLQTLELSAEGFELALAAVPVATLDRTSSMLAGPFFTSSDHPIPSTPEGMLLPVVQLDLRELSELSGQDLGDGLFQLWCDPGWSNSDRARTIVIPRADVHGQTPTPFSYEPHPEMDNSPVPDELLFDPETQEIEVVSAYRSTGMQSQTSYLEIYTEELPDEVRDAVIDDLFRFQELAESEFKLHVLGSFRPIQYSAADIGWNCLIHFPSWGSSGNAQVFFTLSDGEMAFRFEESLR
jgi:hypothetical protein